MPSPPSPPGKTPGCWREQARRFRPRLAVLGEEKAAWELKGRLADTDVRVSYGEEGLLEAASMEECDMVLNALVGVAGLQPTVAALRSGAHPGPGQQGVFGVRRRPGDGAWPKRKAFPFCRWTASTRPFSSAMGNRPLEEVRRVLLTASGGPFFGKSREELRGMTAAGSPAPPQLEHGEEDHRGLGHHDEQGL